LSRDVKDGSMLLAALIVRGVSFEYRGKYDAAAWRRTWGTALTSGSLLTPLLIGVALRTCCRACRSTPNRNTPDRSGLCSSLTGCSPRHVPRKEEQE
jgi:cytochrome bd-type quinol oxidase subunit 2